MRFIKKFKDASWKARCESKSNATHRTFLMYVTDQNQKFNVQNPNKYNRKGGSRWSMTEIVEWKIGYNWEFLPRSLMINKWNLWQTSLTKTI